MRILMVVHNIAGKGAYWRAQRFGRHLASRGHLVTLVAMSPRRRIGCDTYIERGVRIVETPDLLWGPLRSGWDPWEILVRALWLRGRYFDLIHSFDARPTALLPALYLHARRRIPLVMDWGDWFGRGGAVEERPGALVRTILRPVETFFEESFRTRADATTVICSTLRDKAVALGVPPETVLLLPDGSDVEELQSLDRDECRRALGLPPDVPIIGYVGVIFARDAQLMACAFDRIHAALPSARLLLVGYMNAPVEQMVQTSEAVIRTGRVDQWDLNRFLAACDLCWLPLRDSPANRGRWPMKLNDYMAVGRPTVATAVGDVTQVMQVHDMGSLCRDTPEDLAAGVLALLADRERCARLGCNARRVAEDVFDCRLQAAELEKLYERAISRRAHLAL